MLATLLGVCLSVCVRANARFCVGGVCARACVGGDVCVRVCVCVM